jgi:hypothetical protein
MKRSLLAVSVVLASASAASAHGYGYGYGDSIDRREYSQEKRIQQGVRNGSLTRYEYQRLEAEQARIRGLEARARRDGIITPYERYELRRAQDEASRHIRRERHDADRRSYPYWRRWW